MSEIDYSAEAAFALESLRYYGRTITRRAYTAGAYDTSTGTSTATTTDTSRTGALFDYDRGTQFVRGSLIQAGDKRLYVDATAAAAITDHWIIGGTEYTVVSVGEINPAGTAVLYDLHLRLT